MHSPKEKMPEVGQKLWLRIRAPAISSEGYFDGKQFWLVQSWFDYEVLPCDVEKWKYMGAENEAATYDLQSQKRQRLK